MSSYYANENIDVPEWDVALEALLVEECRKNEFLDLDQIQTMAAAYQIRFDDIMITLFELILHKHWAYYNDEGVMVGICRNDVNKLYKNGRIHIEDLDYFDGQWRFIS
ncbi:hypothetical protein MNBD_GAMMA12-1556 [hydrothermal vent metagenome]|uniref:Uncharacterized protein n=1 Tax=hydrothermal vent metagenome TaxID=652676 RepID=A0A3B0Z326_9ZZZZ